MTMTKPTKTLDERIKIFNNEGSSNWLEADHFIKDLIADRKRLMDALELAKRHISQRFDYVSLIALKKIDAILNPKQESRE